MRLDSLNTSIQDVEADGESYKAAIRSLVFNEKSGFRLKRFETNAFYGAKGVSLTQTVIQTNRSIIDGDLDAKYASIKSAGDNPGEVAIDAEFTNTNLVLNDLLYFST